MSSGCSARPAWRSRGTRSRRRPPRGCCPGPSSWSPASNSTWARLKNKSIIEDMTRILNLIANQEASTLEGARKGTPVHHHEEDNDDAGSRYNEHVCMAIPLKWPCLPEIGTLIPSIPTSPKRAVSTASTTLPFHLPPPQNPPSLFYLAYVLSRSRPALS